MRVAQTIVLSDEEKTKLVKLARAKVTSVRLAQRAQIVLLAALGMQNKDIAEQLGVGRVQVARWRARYAECGLEEIEQDLPRGAPPLKVDVKKLVKLTTQTTPEAATHWSTRKTAAVLGVSASTVRRHWQANGLKPDIVRGFKVSRDPRFVEKLDDIVGLYMSPPEHALVLCCDEKSQVQALDRTQSGLPLKKGRAATMTHDCKRHGTTTLFAALSVLDGKIIGQCQQRHTHAGWLKFLRKIDRETPKDKTLHLIADNYARHKHPAVQQWLARHPRVNMHFTPTSASWLNMVERLFRDLTTERLCRGVFTSVPELVAAIDEYVAHHNHHPQAVPLDKERTRYAAEGHSREYPLKAQTERNTAIAAAIENIPDGASVRYRIVARTGKLNEDIASIRNVCIDTLKAYSTAINDKHSQARLHMPRDC